MQSRTTLMGLIVACAAGGFPGAGAAGEDAETLWKAGRYGEAASQYVQRSDWNSALRVYEAQAKAEPRKPDGWLGVGNIRRWQGHLDESRQAYQKARALAPDSVDAALGIAATYRLDHDFDEARRHYDQAVKKWSTDGDVRQATEAFARETNPRAYVFFEDDLSFRTRQAGVVAPFSSREEMGYEYGTEERPGSNIRRDQKLLYTHHFGLNHALDLSARQSRYSYYNPVSDFTAIDSFEEYRVRYKRPVTPEQVVAVRWTSRPTILKNARDSFTAHKFEAELESRWTPRLLTTIGTGALRDLDGNANTVSDLRTTTLVKLGAEAVVNSQLQVSGLYITNPDLDNTVDSTRILRASYQLTDNFSSLVRYRFDDYKTGADQDAWYLGARYTPDTHIWSEFGVKFVERGDRSGTYPLASLVYRF